jgi:hypothetical protein
VLGFLRKEEPRIVENIRHRITALKRAHDYTERQALRHTMNERKALNCAVRDIESLLKLEELTLDTLTRKRVATECVEHNWKTHHDGNAPHVFWQQRVCIACTKVEVMRPDLPACRWVHFGFDRQLAHRKAL